MKHLVIIIFALLFSTDLWAQQLSDTISIVKNRRYYQHGAQISQNELKLLMKEYDASYALMKKAQSFSTTSTVFYVIGATTVLGGLLIPDNKNKLIVASAGLGVEVIALLISCGYKPNVKKAINIYNAKKKAGEKLVTFNISSGLSDYGIGIIIGF